MLTENKLTLTKLLKLNLKLNHNNKILFKILINVEIIQKLNKITLD